MLSKAQNKYIRSLSQQKNRKEYGVFLAEGDKIAKEWLLSGKEIQMIVALEAWAEANEELISKHPEATLHIATEQDLESISTLQTPNGVLLVVPKPAQAGTVPGSGWCIALDNIQDPGNMGTIIRIADWFGIDHIYCSPDCVEIYNPKVIQAAMGGHLRVQVHTADLNELIVKTSLPIIAATLDGTDIHKMPAMNEGMLIIGNESKGISKEIQQMATHKVMIPRRGGAESLNAGVSAGILCAMLVK